MDHSGVFLDKSTITSIILNCVFSINDVVGLLAWKDADVLDEITKIYAAKYNSDLEEDLVAASEAKHHPVIAVCMSENRDDEEDWDMVQKSVKVWDKIFFYKIFFALFKYFLKPTKGACPGSGGARQRGVQTEPELRAVLPRLGHSPGHP